MKLKIAGYTIDKYNEVSVSLHYNSVASSFRFKVQFDPNNSVHKKLFLPGSYHPCQLYYKNVLVITGICLIGDFEDSAVESLVSISGYSTTGVLEDCCIVATPAQSTNLSLKQIAEKVCAHYSIPIQIDPEVAEICNQVIPDSTPDIDEKVKNYLDKLCSQRNVVLSHTATGELLLTKCKANKLLTTIKTLVKATPTPVSEDLEGGPEVVQIGPKNVEVNRPILYSFKTADNAWTKMRLTFNGQKMHSDIVVYGQGIEGNASQSGVAINPYVYKDNFYKNASIFRNKVLNNVNPLGGVSDRGNRPLNKIQTSGDVNTSDAAARNVLSVELRAMSLVIDVPTWVLGGNLITPNQMITAINPNCYLYKETKFFIQDVELRGDERSETATITCVVPEAYNDEVVKNIFA